MCIRDSFRDNNTSTEGALSVAGSSGSNAHFRLLKTEMNNTAWQTYGVAYSQYQICDYGVEIFDFTITGQCDGSAISVTAAAESKIVLTPRVSSDRSHQYHVWCGYIPDDLDRLSNKIF